MKGKSLLLILLIAQAASAQLTISTGSRLSMVGNIQLTLQNMDLVNNGNFTTGSGMLSFTGNNSTSVSGSQPIQFFELEIKKTNRTLLRLQRAISVTNRVLFTSGFLDLNGFNTDLGNSGHLDGEQENARVVGTIGGEVTFNVNLNTPIGSNPANLGLLISSNQNLGSVTIKRGHRAQVIPGVGNSVLRYYDISPANNANLNATLRFTYFNGELNALDENQLTYFRSTDLVTWSALSFTSRDTALNFVNNTGIASFSRFTLAGALNDPLPVRYTLLNIKCEADKVVITWKTAQEQNSNHFNIERSTDGIQWTAIGNRLAAGNSTTEKSYVYDDNNPMQNSYYRIAEYGNDGRVQYSGVLRSPCSVHDMFTTWPNPVQGQLYINIATTNGSSATIKLFDSKGALVKVQKVNLLRGSNLVKIDLTLLANGSYSLFAEWNNGQMRRTVPLLKQ